MYAFYLIETLLSSVLCRVLYHALSLLLLLGTSQFINFLPARLVIILVIFVHYYTFLHIHYHRPYHSVCPPQYQFHLPPVGYPPCLIQMLSICLRVINPLRHPIQYPCTVSFTHVLFPLFNMIRHFSLTLLILLLILHSQFLNCHSFLIIIFSMGGLVPLIQIPITPLMFTLLTRPKFCTFILYKHLLIYTLHSYHRLLLNN